MVMSGLTIEDIMTRHVITVTPATPIHTAARLMVEHRVSGLPVLDEDGRLVGIITEGDLIVRHRRPRERPWWHAFFTDCEWLAREFRKAVGSTAAEVMTHPVVAISPAWGIETAAAILQNRSIGRLPVMRDGRLVGIVSRADLIKALASGTDAGATPDTSTGPKDA
jgi:CBS domain-containing protein